MTVINEDLIRSCIYIPPSSIELEDKKNRDANVLQQQLRELPDFHEVQCLVFSFKGITKIDHLVGLRMLTKLQLDNNKIEKIECLSHLTSLTWLDLSFNKIKKIEGLEGLTKLQDLTLFNNEISELSGMDDLSQLNCLSVGNNRLSRLECVMYLRRFRSLQLVTFTGNPFCQPESEYRTYVLAHLRYLKFLDYRLIDASQVEAAREQFQDELVGLEESEDKEERERVAAIEKAAYLERLHQANLDNIDDLFDSLFTEDPERERMALFSELIRQAKQEYREAVEGVMTDFKNSMFALCERKAEKEEHMALMEEAKRSYESETVLLVHDVEKRKQHTLEGFSPNESPDVVEEALADLRKFVDGVYERLMELEMEQVEMYQGYLIEYEKKLQDFSNNAMESIQQCFMKITSEEDQFADKLHELFQSEYEKRLTEDAEGHNERTQYTMDMHDDDVAEDDDTAGADDEDGGAASEKRSEQGAREAAADMAKRIIEDKDLFSNILQESHDARVKLIDAMEGELSDRETHWLKKTVATVNDQEYVRNRSRVSEISSFIHRIRAEVDDFERGDTL